MKYLMDLSKRKNFPTNPASGGIPAKLNAATAIATAKLGHSFASPERE